MAISLTIVRPRAFLDRLKREHAIAPERPSREGPGSAQDRSNRVGDHLFVEPSYVAGTLSEGWHCVAD